MICGTTPLTFSIIALPMTMTEVGHPHPFFAGRVAVIATMHRKQEAIAPPGGSPPGGVCFSSGDLK